MTSQYEHQINFANYSTYQQNPHFNLPSQALQEISNNIQQHQPFPLRCNQASPFMEQTQHTSFNSSSLSSSSLQHQSKKGPPVVFVKPSLPPIRRQPAAEKGILHEFFCMNSSTSEAAKRAERTVLRQEKSAPRDKPYYTDRVIKYSSIGPMKMTTRIRTAHFPRNSQTSAAPSRCAS
ncbi:unnamed protein product [Auanema sp. JU1783]|nr:unnamed protein product [Auanema sp. JU1783]